MTSGLKGTHASFPLFPRSGAVCGSFCNLNVCFDLFSKSVESKSRDWALRDGSSMECLQKSNKPRFYFSIDIILSKLINCSVV